MVPVGRRQFAPCRAKDPAMSKACPTAPRVLRQALDNDRLFGDQLVAILPVLRRFARGLCGQAAMAEDLAQEAVMRGWAARDSFVPGTNLRAWMCVILRNRFYTSIRAERWSASWDPLVAERLLVCAPAQEDSTRIADVARALECLPASQREMLMLVGAGGLTYEQAAKATGCALGTVKSRLARGRAALTLAVDGPQDDILFQRQIRPQYA
jgi:RNA polymerase sigma-70 factor (ECF subfamily)